MIGRLTSTHPLNNRQAVMPRPAIGRLWLLLLVAGTLAACRPNLLRYDNLARCLGYFAEAPEQRLPAGEYAFGFPVNERSAQLNLFWRASNGSFALWDANDTLHLIDRGGAPIAEQGYHIM